MKDLHHTLYLKGGSGLSNLVMSWEIGVIAASLLGRRLVVDGNAPPSANVVQYEGIDKRVFTRVSDLLEIPVEWIEAEPPPDPTSDIIALGDGLAMDSVFVWPPTLDRQSDDFRHFAHGRRKVITATPVTAAAPALRLFPPSQDGIASENFGFYSYFFYLDPPTRRDVHALLRRMRPRAPYQALADRVSESLGPFNAVHIRRGDFKLTYGTTTRVRKPAEAIRVLDQNFDPEARLLILTDERQDPFFDEVCAHYRDSIFVDHYILEHHREEFDALPNHDSIVLAFLSQLVAARAEEFVGTMTSTYTSLVQRYRGNAGRDERFRFLWNELPDPGVPVVRGAHLPSHSVPLRPDGRMVEVAPGPYSWNRVGALLNPAWQREWPESLLSDPSSLSTLGARPDSADELDMQSDPAIVDVTLHLDGGHSIRTKLAADSDVLRELFEVFATAASEGSRAAPRIVQVPTEAGHSAFTFPSGRLVAIETSPPVLLDQAVSQVSESPPVAARPVEPGPEEVDCAPRRHPPITHEVSDATALSFESVPELDPPPFVQFTDFLTPNEHEALLDATLAAKASVLPTAGWCGRKIANALDPPHAERIAGRLQLLLPQILSRFDPTRRVEADALELWACGDGDMQEASSASAANPQEITCSYFFQRAPGAPTGGELAVREQGELLRLAPRDNAVIVFRSAALEEVTAVRGDTSDFGDRRFCITARIA